MSRGRVKGTIMIEVVKYLRSRKEEARPLLPLHLKPYLNTRILATSWHPEQDYLDLMHVLIALRPRSTEDAGLGPWEAAARVSTANFFAEGPYKSMVRKGEPGRTLASLDALWRLRHDTGRFQVESTGPNQARLELRDYAVEPGDSCSLVQGTIWGFLYYSEGKNIAIEHTKCRARGDAACEWQASWTL
jgi:hypothetical protein